MEDRSRAILNAIVREFITTAEPVGSKTLVMSYHFSVSPATIRNEMAGLEEEGLIFQPHTSAGRIPTDQGYRLYVDSLADYDIAEREAEKHLSFLLKERKIAKAREKIYDCVSLLAQATGCASFATTPDNARTFYLGFANVLKEPEFCRDPLHASQVMEVLEENDNFITTLRTLDLGEEGVQIFIGKENILPQIQSCSLIIAEYQLEGFTGYFGLLGPTRTRYPYNLAMVKKVRDILI
ncbi:heat-inducible transcriptional repressor HrcA [Candidatus Peregrinibacteria bacterium CG_4_9_14_0_2_um_filter_53_11]|nr:MAG: heat-inducible transcriptional repressor HrcA [Candidatus Peregrinibacteria bacterium CG_4_9_14_0_2_um_filter_53_11]